MSEKHMKLAIYPRKISNCSQWNEEQSEKEKGKLGNKEKMSRVLSLDKQLFKTARCAEPE